MNGELSMVNRELEDEECDVRDDDQGTEVGNKKIKTIGEIASASPRK